VFRAEHGRAVAVLARVFGDLDVTTADMVASLVRDMQERGITLAFAQVRGPVRDRLRRMGLMEAVSEGGIYASVGAAVDGLRPGPRQERDA